MVSACLSVSNITEKAPPLMAKRPVSATKVHAIQVKRGRWSMASMTTTLPRRVPDEVVSMLRMLCCFSMW